MIVASLALVFALYIYPRMINNGWAAFMKLKGRAPDCSWGQIAFYYDSLINFAEIEERYSKSVTVKDYERIYDVELISIKGLSFWIKRSGQRPGTELIAYLHAEHEWMGSQNPLQVVNKGEVVIDCGTHVGVFTHNALERDAKRVISIEPEPTNLECLRRNFAAEIQSGRVTIVPKGVWNSEGSLELTVNSDNSGTPSMVRKQPGYVITVVTTLIDKLVRELDLGQVDYIKMDIEGAEREALLGARETLIKYHPTLMIDSYHLPDDMSVLPKIVRQINSEYSMICGPCQRRDDSSNDIIPHVIYFQFNRKR